MERAYTEAVINEVVEGVSIAVVGELVARRRQLLEALRGYAGEVTGEFSELRQNHGAASNERVDQRLLPHQQSLTPTVTKRNSPGKKDPRFRKRGSKMEREMDYFVEE
ncbi:hypothetical protein SLA2020_031430 [Shorea laevis]